MKNLTTAIYSKFVGSTFAGLVGNRFFKGRAPDGIEYPYATYSVVTTAPERTFTEDYENTVIQFSLFSITNSTLEIENIYDNMKTLYDECSLSITDSTLVWMRRSNTTFDVVELMTPQGTEKVWAYFVDFEIKTSLD